MPLTEQELYKLQVEYDLRLEEAARNLDRLGVPAYDWWNECLHGVGRAGIATVYPKAIGMAAAWVRRPRRRQHPGAHRRLRAGGTDHTPRLSWSRGRYPGSTRFEIRHLVDGGSRVFGDEHWRGAFDLAPAYR